MNLPLLFCTSLAITILHMGDETSGQSVSEPSSLALANNAFAVKLYSALKSSGQNLVCSPLSLSIVLSMLLEGSPVTSNTFTQIQNALQYSNLKLTDIETDYKQLLTSLQSGQGYTLDLADSIWIKERFTVMDAFKQKAIEYFKAEIDSLSETGGANQINAWVANHTGNKITNLLTTLDPSVIMVLVNAIYFKASWDKPFDKRDSVKGAFMSNDNANSKKMVTLMQQTNTFSYTDSTSLNAQVVVLNYQGLKTSLVVILPHAGSTLDSLDQSLSAGNIQDAITKAAAQKVNVILPKYSITSSLPLNAPLQAMGIKDAFTGQADFSNINNSVAIQVTEVMQKAIIEVAENGTVAAAATVAVISLTLAEGPPLIPVTFRADHPFIYLLYHKPTSSIIFIGRYTSPSQ